MLLHLGLFHLGQNVIRFRTLLHLGLVLREDQVYRHVRLLEVAYIRLRWLYQWVSHRLTPLQTQQLFPVHSISALRHKPYMQCLDPRSLAVHSDFFRSQCLCGGSFTRKIALSNKRLSSSSCPDAKSNGEMICGISNVSCAICMPSFAFPLPLDLSA